MSRKKFTEKEMDYRYAMVDRICKTITRVISGVVKYGCVFGCVYFFSDAIKHFAGTNTEANVLMNIITNLKMNQWFGYVVGGGGLVYGGIRNKQLKNTRKEHAEYMKKLELTIDPRKQSSRLNLFGETNEDDR
jgi:hypothetical protein